MMMFVKNNSKLVFVIGVAGVEMTLLPGESYHFVLPDLYTTVLVKQNGTIILDRQKVDTDVFIGLTDRPNACIDFQPTTMERPPTDAMIMEVAAQLQKCESYNRSLGNQIHLTPNEALCYTRYLYEQKGMRLEQLLDAIEYIKGVRPTMV
jgi:hypothetical protein